MGNVLGVVLGVGNRPRQGRAVLEILLLAYVLKKIHVEAQDPTAQCQAVSPASLGCESDTTAASSDTESTASASTTSVVSADSVAAHHTDSFPAVMCSSPASLLSRVNTALRRFQPVQLILAMLIGVHIWRNLSLLLGLNAPHHSVTQEPDMHYSPHFAGVRWLLTGLDAATLSTLKVKIPVLRHALTIILSAYYLINFRTAENKINAFRGSMTADAVRACWEKGTTPLLGLVGRIMRKKCTIDMEPIYIPSPDGHQIECRLFYAKDREQLQHEKKLVLDFPGGGFLAMDPAHHAEYLAHWAHVLGVPVLSIKYRKAPENPYPCGFEDVWYVYKAIVESNGSVLGLNSGSGRSDDPIRICAVGDSAGGNFAAGITVKAIMESMRVPDGVHLIYPVLDFSCTVWKPDSLPPPNTKIQARPQQPRARPLRKPNGEPVESEDVQAATKEALDALDAKAVGPSTAMATPPPTVRSESAIAAAAAVDRSAVVPQLSSRTMYAFDGVLPFKYMLLIAECYFRNGGDPVNDPFASPAVASDEVLAKFPPIYAHVGSVDPLSDDVINFTRRAQRANRENDIYLCVIPKVSHAYMQVPQFLPEAQIAVDLSTVWIAKILDVPLTAAAIDLDRPMTKMGMRVMNMKDWLHESEERVQHEEASAQKQEAGKQLTAKL